VPADDDSSLPFCLCPPGFWGDYCEYYGTMSATNQTGCSDFNCTISASTGVSESLPYLSSLLHTPSSSSSSSYSFLFSSSHPSSSTAAESGGSSESGGEGGGEGGSQSWLDSSQQFDLSSSTSAESGGVSSDGEASFSLPSSSSSLSSLSSSSYLDENNTHISSSIPTFSSSSSSPSPFSSSSSPSPSPSPSSSTPQPSVVYSRDVCKLVQVQRVSSISSMALQFTLHRDLFGLTMGEFCSTFVPDISGVMSVGRDDVDIVSINQGSTIVTAEVFANSTSTLDDARVRVAAAIRLQSASPVFTWALADVTPVTLPPPPQSQAEAEAAVANTTSTSTPVFTTIGGLTGTALLLAISLPSAFGSLLAGALIVLGGMAIKREREKRRKRGEKDRLHRQIKKRLAVEYFIEGAQKKKRAAQYRDEPRAEELIMQADSARPGVSVDDIDAITLPRDSITTKPASTKSSKLLQKVAAVALHPVEKGGEGEAFLDRTNFGVSPARVVLPSHPDETMRCFVRKPLLAVEKAMQAGVTASSYIAEETAFWRAHPHRSMEEVVGLVKTEDGYRAVTKRYTHASLKRHAAAHLSSYTTSSAFRFALDVTNGLVHLHKHRTVYGWLSPAKVLVDDNHRALLHSILPPWQCRVDRHLVLGYELYIAPELVTSRDVPALTLDVFCLGALLWELLEKSVKMKRVDYLARLRVLDVSSTVHANAPLPHFDIDTTFLSCLPSSCFSFFAHTHACLLSLSLSLSLSPPPLSSLPCCCIVSPRPAHLCMLSTYPLSLFLLGCPHLPHPSLTHYSTQLSDPVDGGDPFGMQQGGGRGWDADEALRQKVYQLGGERFSDGSMKAAYAVALACMAGDPALRPSLHAVRECLNDLLVVEIREQSAGVNTRFARVQKRKKEKSKNGEPPSSPLPHPLVGGGEEEREGGGEEGEKGVAAVGLGGMLEEKLKALKHQTKHLSTAAKGVFGKREVARINKTVGLYNSMKSVMREYQARTDNFVTAMEDERQRQLDAVQAVAEQRLRRAQKAAVHSSEGALAGQTATSEDRASVIRALAVAGTAVNRLRSPRQGRAHAGRPAPLTPLPRRKVGESGEGGAKRQ